MGKYKRLKKAHEELKEDVAQLVITLKSEGSLDAHCNMCTQHIGGKHSFRIDKNRMDIKAVQFHIGKLEEAFGIELTHTDEWNYTEIEREDTDE